MFRKEERIDEIGFGKIKIIQKPGEFCYGIDAVILADFASKIAKKHGDIMDLGTGNGIIPLVLSHKLNPERITGVELQEKSAERARRSIEMNGLQEIINIENVDILKLNSKYDNSMDVVVSNPPYMERHSGLVNENDAKAIARHETTADLRDFFKTSVRVLKERGELFMVHRPSRLVDIFTFAREVGMEPKTMRFVCPKENEEPNIVLVHFVKKGGKELKLLNPLVVYGEDSKYTEEILKIYEK